MRTFTYTANQSCMFDSLTLFYFLRAFGVRATWVFGVQTGPFAAHCWLQQPNRAERHRRTRVALHSHPGDLAESRPAYVSLFRSALGIHANPEQIRESKRIEEYPLGPSQWRIAVALNGLSVFVTGTESTSNESLVLPSLEGARSSASSSGS